MNTSEQLRSALQRFGWTMGPEFERRYIEDPWVFNLANAVEKLSVAYDSLREAASECFYEHGKYATQRQAIYALEAHLRATMEEVPAWR